MQTVAAIGLISVFLLLVAAKSNMLFLRLRVRRRRVALPVSSAAMTPVIFVPGVFGTSLLDPRHGGFPVWGGYKGSFLYNSRYDDMDLGLDEEGCNTLAPGDVLWTFPVVPGLFEVPVYAELAGSLGCLGYESTTANPAAVNRFIPLVHDWRRGVLQGARALERAVNAEIERGAGKVHIIGHSWGSVVIRYYLRYGGANVLADRPEPARPGAPNVDIFFAAGMPVDGSCQALHELQTGYSPGGPIGRPVAPHHIAASVTAYQLLPFGTDAIVDGSAVPVDADLANADVWREFRLGPWAESAYRSLYARAKVLQPNLPESDMETLVDQHLQRNLAQAVRLRELIRLPSEADRSVRTVVYAADTQPTLAKCVLDGDRFMSCFAQVDQHRPELAATVSVPGDGYVSLESVKQSVGPDDENVEIVMVSTGGHRDYLKQDQVLTHLLKSLAMAESGGDNG